MKVGDYVRTKNKSFQPSQIAKIKEIKKDMIYKGQKCLNLDHNLLTNYEFLIYEEDVLKQSPRIIDLIQAGDYVNGYLVEEIYTPINKEIGKLIKFSTDNVSGFEYEAEEIGENDIKSIVTKEQFESMEYKLGE